MPSAIFRTIISNIFGYSLTKEFLAPFSYDSRLGDLVRSTNVGLWSI